MIHKIVRLKNINSIYNICVLGTGKISLPEKKHAVVLDGVLKIENPQNKVDCVNFKVEFVKSQNDLFENNQKVHNLLLKNILDCDKIVGQLKLRVRESGDTIRLKNKNCTKTLKKLYCEYKIPLAEREALPVLVDDKGIVWVHKIGVAERAAADQKSKNIYKINIIKMKMRIILKMVVSLCIQQNKRTIY